MMKNINYFKFLERLPEFIDIDGTSNEIKLTMLKTLKKEFWRKKKNDIGAPSESVIPVLLPIKIYDDIELFRKSGLKDCRYRITFRGENLGEINIVDNRIHYRDILGSVIYIQKEEAINIKRELILKNMLNK